MGLFLQAISPVAARLALSRPHIAAVRPQAGALRPGSQTKRRMLSARLARPIFTFARARPIVRMKTPIGPFRCAKTCSTATRTFDVLALATLMRCGIKRPVGFLRGMRDWKPRVVSIFSFFFDR
jgi:hypothetical protein